MEFTYIFRCGPWTYDIVGSGEISGNEYSDFNLDSEYASDEIIDTLKDAFINNKDEINELAEYCDNVPGMLQFKMNLDPNDNSYIICETIFDHNLSKNEIESVKNYIEGQFADGYGESFEQNSIGSFETEEDYETEEEYDEDNDEYTNSEWEVETVVYDIFVHLWNNSNWTIDLIKNN